MIHMIDTSIEMLNEGLKEEPMMDIKPKAGVGIGVVEAPRGMLYHKVEIDAKGIVKDSDFVYRRSKIFFI